MHPRFNHAQPPRPTMTPAAPAGTAITDPDDPLPVPVPRQGWALAGLAAQERSVPAGQGRRANASERPLTGVRDGVLPPLAAATALAVILLAATWVAAATVTGSAAWATATTAAPVIFALVLALPAAAGRGGPAAITRARQTNGRGPNT